MKKIISSLPESCEELDRGFRAGNLNTLEDLSCPDENRKSDSQHREQLTKDVTSVRMDELCTPPFNHERSPMKDLVQVEATLCSQNLVVPNANHKWLGKFQMHNNEGITRTCDGIQAHLSNFASIEVVQMVDRLPEIIILEELPRRRIWPSQFIRSQITEENIALYLFAHDFNRFD
ncbi:unnamed protein product [Sphenostylis stenocarpa]|uniref:AIPP2-like SPOC-like domain-containing protein n=1 Tax=Sphenostylis stenocarpa TaxID=92480 RepID=A0AA86VBN0_9FABA|nr:unnamed protein product [Sphenostylis stenocarpa]